MLKKAARALEKWGHYLLALLCAGAILLSALWTNGQRAREQPETQALSDASQRLGQATDSPPAAFARPAGDVVREYSLSPRYFPACGVWKIHPAVDFAAEAGEKVYALADGLVLKKSPGLWIDHGGGVQSVCRGLAQAAVQPGDQVRRGDCIGTAGEEVPFEGGGHVCVQVLRGETPVDFWHDTPSGSPAEQAPPAYSP